MLIIATVTKCTASTIYLKSVFPCSYFNFEIIFGVLLQSLVVPIMVVCITPLREVLKVVRELVVASKRVSVQVSSKSMQPDNCLSTER